MRNLSHLQTAKPGPWHPPLGSISSLAPHNNNGKELMGETPAKKEKQPFIRLPDPPQQRVCATRYLLARRGPDMMGLADDIGFFKMLALNAVMPIAPSPTAHSTRWFSAVCFLLISLPPGSGTALGSQGMATTPPTPPPSFP